MELSDIKIQQILKSYENKKIKEKQRYQIIKDSEEFIMKNRERAKAHYNNNKDIKKNNYNNNKDFLTARSQYYYYKKIDKLEMFKNKYPERYLILESNNIIF
tara:strand:- start:62 stop:367 length:306 start_codon:yes stop_codon:yes gene_type:complete